MVNFRRCYLCDKTSDSSQKRALHKFPTRSSNELRFVHWLHVLDLKEWDDVRTLYICSTHFTPEDFFYSNFGGRLKPLSVPSVGVPNPPLVIPLNEPVLPPPSHVAGVGAESGYSSDEISDGLPIVPVCELLCDMPDQGEVVQMDISPRASPENQPVLVSVPVPDSPVSSVPVPVPDTPVSSVPVPVPDTPVSSLPVLGEESTPVKDGLPLARRSEQPRYISELLLSDVVTPRRAARTIKFVRVTDNEKSQKCRRLQKCNRRLQAQNLELHHALANLQDKLAEVVSERTTNTLGVPVVATGPSQYDLASVMKDVRTSPLPKDWTYTIAAGKVVLFYFGDRAPDVPEEAAETTRSICVNENMILEVRARGKLYAGNIVDTPVRSKDDLFSAMEKVSRLSICSGLIDGSCSGEAFLDESNRTGRCSACRKFRSDRVNKSAKVVRRLIMRRRRMHQEKQNIRRKIRRLQVTLDQTVQEVTDLKSRCANVQKTALEEAIKNFPREQQEALRACLNAAQCKGPTGRRYTNDWILECLLLRIKSKKAYLHIRNHNILPLPTLATLDKYLSNMRPSYGFSMETLTMLRAKALKMQPWQLRGAISVDEMKLSEGISFDSNKHMFTGFVDLGEHTPENQRKERGDHALVFLFQPFCGKWVQTVGAFLSKGCAKSDVLHKLILEIVVLLENCGFRIDVITTDGAQWNRAMWKLFGLTGQECSCRHPCAGESNRRLWFCSDFHHLVKNFRNFLMDSEETWTPQGVVKKEHYRAVLRCDNGGGPLGLRIAHKLTEDALDPKFYKKMNVGLALQLFRPEVAAAMRLYQARDEGLDDCGPTISFMETFWDVICAMSSQRPDGALSPGSDSYKDISDFIGYLRDWQVEAEDQNCKFMSNNTFLGFIVTLTTALELCTFLKEECNFQYLMTARINQDALEGFFGMVRSSCGSHDHPDPLLFIQVYRLLSFYSLVKPPKGSNVESVEVFETLLNYQDANEQSDDNQADWEEILDIMIAKGPDCAEVHRAGDEHDYNVRTVNEHVQAYFSGFVAHRMRKWTTCPECRETLTKEEGDQPRDALINAVSKGYLLYPSDNLYGLLSACERAILKTVGTGEVEAYTFMRIADNILAESAPFVGCPEHEGELTKRIVNYYTVSRSRILARVYNRVHDERRQNEQRLRKQTKL